MFEREYKDVTEESNVIKKWVEPVRVRVKAMTGRMIDKADGGRELKLENARPTKESIASIRKHLTKLVKLTGVKSEDAKKVGKRPNFFITFVPRLAMAAPFLAPGVDPAILRRGAGPGVCYFITAAKDGAIVWATIVVNIEMTDAAIDACLLEEMTQAFGLPNDSDIVKPSIFNQWSTRRSYSRNDIILLRTLYDPRMKVGLRRPHARAVATRVITELNAKLEP